VKERDAASLYLGFSGLVLHIISERIKPGEHARIPFPWRLLTTWCGCADALQRLSFRFESGQRVAVRRVEADVPEPAADDGDVDAR
jgi:hypothetical protein